MKITERRRRRWQFSLRSLLVGTAAAAVALTAMSWINVPGDVVIIVAAVVAVLIEAAIHRRGLNWLLKRGRKGR